MISDCWIFQDDGTLWGFKRSHHSFFLFLWIYFIVYVKPFQWNKPFFASSSLIFWKQDCYWDQFMLNVQNLNICLCWACLHFWGCSRHCYFALHVYLFCWSKTSNMLNVVFIHVFFKGLIISVDDLYNAYLQT